MAKAEATVEELVGMIARGELRLPEMQRRYVWRSTRVRDLLDSLYRGYPSGAILLWETDEKVSLQEFAVVQQGNPYSSMRLLLDGQQRLTALSAVLRGTGLGDSRNESRPLCCTIRDRRVPLSGRALAILHDVPRLSDGTGLVFRSLRGKPLSNITLSKLIKELGIAAVPHGFRSSFRDWAAERTSTPREVVETALAHTIQNPTEAAYARSDLFERRRRLMDDWAAYLSGEGRVADAARRGHRRATVATLPCRPTFLSVTAQAAPNGLNVGHTGSHRSINCSNISLLSASSKWK